jgi:hypothetical protein
VATRQQRELCLGCDSLVDHGIAERAASVRRDHEIARLDSQVGDRALLEHNTSGESRPSARHSFGDACSARRQTNVERERVR